MKLAVPSLRRPIRLRWHLLILVVGTLLPLVLFSTVVVLRLANEQRQAALRRLTYSSHLMGEAVEQELSSTIRTLEALAESDRLAREDLRGFWTEAKRVHRTQPTWLAILLVAPDGQQLLTTSQPYGTPLPRVAEPDSLHRLLQTGKSTVGTLARGRQGGRWAFPVRVPVRRKGKIRFVLTAAITLQALTQTVVRQLPPSEEWTRTVLDRNHVIIARTRDPERFIGKSATAGLIERLKISGDGIYRNQSIDGVSVYAAFLKTRQSGWVTIVTAAASSIDEPVADSLMALASAGIAVLLLSVAGAYALSRRVSQGIHSASRAAAALAHGQQPNMTPSAISEFARLSDALQTSSQLLTRRSAERDELLTRSDLARSQAETANRAKDEFLAMLGHELRNPLSPIVTALEVLRLRGQDKSREWEIIDRQTRHMATLVEDLLDVSRITRGKIELSLEPLELSLVAARAVEMVSPLIAEHRHELVVNVPEEGLRVQGEAPRLVQVVTNLLTNAARYTPPGGRIELSARREGEWIELHVQDNGPGLSDELRSRVFEVFVQGPRGPDRREGGLGLGLAIVQNLVRLHGGTVSAVSDGPGKGSTFTVRLPASTTE
jgi:signal transduction histidine kinase